MFNTRDMKEASIFLSDKGRTSIGIPVHWSKGTRGDHQIVSQNTKSMDLVRTQPRSVQYFAETNTNNDVPLKRHQLTLTDKDVVLGKGRIIQNLPGNIQFRNMVRSLTNKYELASNRIEKTFLTMQVVADIKNSGGRFLKEDAEGEVYVEVPSDVARLKVSSAFHRYRHLARLKTSTSNTNVTALPTPACKNNATSKSWNTGNVLPSGVRTEISESPLILARVSSNKVPHHDDSTMKLSIPRYRGGFRSPSGSAAHSTALPHTFSSPVRGGRVNAPPGPLFLTRAAPMNWSVKAVKSSSPYAEKVRGDDVRLVDTHHNKIFLNMRASRGVSSIMGTTWNSGCHEETNLRYNEPHRYARTSLSSPLSSPYDQRSMILVESTLPRPAESTAPLSSSSKRVKSSSTSCGRVTKQEEARPRKVQRCPPVQASERRQLVDTSLSTSSTSRPSSTMRHLLHKQLYEEMGLPGF